MFAFFILFISLINSQTTYPKEVKRLWDLENQFGTKRYVTWGTNYESIYKKDRLWIKQDTTIHFYDLGDNTATPVKTKTMPTATQCKNSFTSLIAGNKFISYHGNDAHCTCAWAADNPCPHKLQIAGTGIDYAGSYEFFSNTVLPMENVIPDVTGKYGIAEPQEACTAITNPEEIAGKWCVVWRGSCFFQDKWDHCNAAGAIGTLLVMRDDTAGASWQMWVQAVSTPMIGVHNTIGEKLKVTWDNGNRDVTLSAGRSIGVDSPDPEYSGHDPLVTINYYTGERTEDAASHFETVLQFIVNEKTDYGHFIGVDGKGDQVQVYDLDQSPPLFKGNYSVGTDGGYAFIYRDDPNQPDTIMYTTNFWTGEINFYDMTDEINPVYISTLTFEKCGDEDNADYAYIHPNQNYLYWVSLIHVEGCPYSFALYDISSLTDIQKITDIHLPEVDLGADIAYWTWGLNNIATLTMSSSGVTWYDFTDPADPQPVAHIDINEAEDTYTLGARQVAQLSDGVTYILQDYTENWFNFHAVQLVDPPAPTPNATIVEVETVTENNTETIRESDGDEDVWRAVAIVLLVFAILGMCGSCFFFYKYNKEQAFKFGQMKDFVASEMTKTGSDISHGGAAASP